VALNNTLSLFLVFGTFSSLESLCVASVFSLFFMSRMYMLFGLLVAVATNLPELFSLKISILLLSRVILGRSIWKVYHKVFIFYPTSTPSSHRMRDNPFLGQYTLKSKEIRKWRGIIMKSGKYGRKQYDGSLRKFLVSNPFPKRTTY
jgi:hypothetical protein